MCPWDLSGGYDVLIGQNKAAILTASIRVAIDKFNNRHWCIVSMAVAGFHHARVAPGAISIARAQRFKQLGSPFLIGQLRRSLPAGAQTAFFA